MSIALPTILFVLVVDSFHFYSKLPLKGRIPSHGYAQSVRIISIHCVTTLRSGVSMSKGATIHNKCFFELINELIASPLQTQLQCRCTTMQEHVTKLTNNQILHPSCPFFDHATAFSLCGLATTHQRSWSTHVAALYQQQQRFVTLLPADDDCTVESVVPHFQLQQKHHVLSTEFCYSFPLLYKRCELTVVN